LVKDVQGVEEKLQRRSPELGVVRNGGDEILPGR
jgi:hypothetical protein